MSEIKKCTLDLDGSDHFYKCNYLMPLHFKGLTGASSSMLELVFVQCLFVLCVDASLDVSTSTFDCLETCLRSELLYVELDIKFC